MAHCRSLCCFSGCRSNRLRSAILADILRVFPAVRPASSLAVASSRPDQRLCACFLSSQIAEFRVEGDVNAVLCAFASEPAFPLFEAASATAASASVAASGDSKAEAKPAAESKPQQQQSGGKGKGKGRKGGKAPAPAAAPAAVAATAAAGSSVDALLAARSAAVSKLLSDRIPRPVAAAAATVAGAPALVTRCSDREFAWPPALSPERLAKQFFSLADDSLRLHHVKPDIS